MKARQLEAASKGGQVTKTNKVMMKSSEPCVKTTTRKELAKIAGVSEYAISTTRR